MKTFENLLSWYEERKNLNSLGFIPTMGALHQGHLSLISRSLNENEKTIVSLYVNPTQFNDKNDLKNYPIHLEEDLKKLKDLAVPYVLLPTYAQLYPHNYSLKVIEKTLSKELCGLSRPGHFDGVLTVVLKLLNIVRPQKVYFGEKDFQQCLLIKKMAEAFFLNCEIISCPIIREKDGLAMSSRNKLLSAQERQLAPQLYRTLRDSSSKDTITIEKHLTELGFQVDYVKKKYSRLFAAVKLGSVRLIDNVEI